MCGVGVWRSGAGEGEQQPVARCDISSSTFIKKVSSQ